MSVLIKDFKIPTGDEPRMFLTHFNDDGTADMIAMGYPQKPYSLVPVPPHGRLIDEKAVIDHFVKLSNNEWNQNVSTSWANAFAEAASDICDIPTIIEAEEET